MVGIGMALVALVMIPLGFGLAWWIVRRLDARAAVDRGVRSRHPSTLPSTGVPLDNAPADVIAAAVHRSHGNGTA